MQALIELRQLSYSYTPNGMALSGLQLDIVQGEMFCIIGQNGSGKSTLLNVLNGLVFPDQGSYHFQGREISEHALKDRHFNAWFRQRMQYVFQNPDLQLFSHSVMDELLFGPLQLEMSPAEARDRARETLSALGIENLCDRPVLSLSGGEKKKVAIAATLVMNPDVILVDEPLAGLDPKTQTFMIELMLQLHHAGKTLIFTTHQLDLVDHLQPRVAVLSDDHSIRKTGTAADILSDQEFLISVNLVHEHVHKHGDQEHRHYHSHYVFHKH